MKAEELRAGNYLKGPEFRIPRLGIWSNGYFKVTPLGIAHFWENPNLSWEPAPLTEEILLKAGFMFNETINMWCKNYGPGANVFLKLMPEYDGFGWQLSESRYKVLKTVHHLQNMWHVHTETELEINL